MGLKDKLDHMCSTAEHYALMDRRRHTRELARLLASVIKAEEWAWVPKKTEQRIFETTNAAVQVAALGDAACFVYDTVLSAVNSKIIDLKCDLDFRIIQNQIYDIFAHKEVPSRGFVYVAWSARPEKFLYVGKAKDRDRLNLAAHGKLARATAEASTLSLLFPGQSRPGTIQRLEAGIIGLIKATTGSMPILNSRRERLPFGDSLGLLGQLGAFLTKVGKSVAPAA